MLFVDQFEETFTLAEAGEAQAFLDALQGLIGRPNSAHPPHCAGRLLPRVDGLVPVEADPSQRLELTPLGDDELWAAIVEPAARVGVKWTRRWPLS